jgi:hypothetical protein
VIALLFALPWWWPAVLVLPVLAWWATRQETRQAARTQVVFGRREVALLGARCWQRTKRVCGVLSGLFCGLALLCPIWGDGPGEPAGPDVVLCLDVSRSMRARDLEPDRLGTAQREIVALTQQAFGARLGLVVFAGTAQLAVPLTADLESVAVLAVAMDPSSVARGGSDLGAAIDTASAALERSHAVAGSMVVLTDGEDFSGAARAAAERARARGVIVHLGRQQDRRRHAGWRSVPAGCNRRRRRDHARCRQPCGGGGGRWRNLRGRSSRRVGASICTVLAAAGRVGSGLGPGP